MSTKEIVVRPTAEQSLAWAEAAGERPVEAWLSELADEAVSSGAGRSWPVVVNLRHPFDVGSERITSLEFRRGKVGDMKGIKLKDELASNDVVLIASRLSGQQVKVIEMLDIDDAGEVTGIAIDFFKKWVAAGRTR